MKTVATEKENAQATTLIFNVPTQTRLRGKEYVAIIANSGTATATQRQDSDSRKTTKGQGQEMEALAQIMLGVAVVTALRGGDVAGSVSLASWGVAVVWGVQKVSARFGD